MDQIIGKKKAASDALTQAIIIAGLRGKQTGIEGGSLGFYFVESIRDTTKVFPLDDQIELIRLEKDDEELAMKRRANRILNSAFETAQKTINPGVNELEVYDAIHHTILMDIREPFILDVTFASGPNTVSRHGSPIGRHLVEGDLFINGFLSNTRDV